MKTIDRIKQMDAETLARWICSEVLNDDCDHCHLECSLKNNGVLKLLNQDDGKDEKGHFYKECISCKRFLNGCKGKPKDKECVCHD